MPVTGITACARKHARQELPEHIDGGGPATAAVRDVPSSIESHGDEPIEWGET